MKSIVVSVTAENDLRLLISLIKKMGFKSKILTPKEQQILLADKFIDFKPNTDNLVTEDEVVYEVKKVRKARYATK